jgi:hypothetical protein
VSWLRRGEHRRKRGRRTVAELREILESEPMTCNRMQKRGWHYALGPTGVRYMCWHSTVYIAPQFGPGTSAVVTNTPPESILTLPTLDAS